MEQNETKRDYEKLVAAVSIGREWNSIAIRQALADRGATFEKLIFDALAGEVSNRLFPGCVCPLCRIGSIRIYRTMQGTASVTRYVQCGFCGATDKHVVTIE